MNFVGSVMHLLICFASPLMLQTRVAAVFVFISFASLLSIAGVPALLKEIKVTFLARHLFFPPMLTSRSLRISQDVVDI